MNYRHAVLIFLLVVPALLLSSGCKSDSGGSTQVQITPITENLFPLVAGHQFQYTGYLVDTNQVSAPAPGQPTPYKASWTLAPGPSGTWILIDSTQVGATTPSVKLLQIKQDAQGDYYFRQTLGPFYRAIQASYTDTLIWVLLAKPSVGVNYEWTAFDTTVNGVVNGVPASIHLQILGIIEGKEIITDSTSAHAKDTTYRIRTHRKITVSGFSVLSTTAVLWLQPNVGPVQIDIAGDPENYGHFRVLSGKNF